MQSYMYKGGLITVSSRDGVSVYDDETKTISYPNAPGNAAVPGYSCTPYGK